MQKFKKYLFACVILSLVLQGCNKNQTASSKPEEEEITVTVIEKAEDEKDEKKEKAAAEKENAESADNAINAESTGNTDGIESAG
ncbi:MAG: hypothetical protein IJ679_08400, partial [Lachnospiraceae bacterium]|nr:hypothetical protein [Lachnospiraceae bacterium]